MGTWRALIEVSPSTCRPQAEEKRRRERPQHLQELLKMDLDAASVRDLRAMMIKMGIPFQDCVEKSDMKRKLIDNVPELRMEMDRRASSASISSLGSSSTADSRTSSVSSGLNLVGDSLGASGNTTNQDEKVRQLEAQVKDFKRRLGAKETEIDDLEMQLKKMTTRANDAEAKLLSQQNSKGVAAPQRYAPVPKVRTSIQASCPSLTLSSSPAPATKLGRQLPACPGAGDPTPGDENALHDHHP